MEHRASRESSTLSSHNSLHRDYGHRSYESGIRTRCECAYLVDKRCSRESPPVPSRHAIQISAVPDGKKDRLPLVHCLERSRAERRQAGVEGALYRCSEMYSCRPGSTPCVSSSSSTLICSW